MRLFSSPTWCDTVFENRNKQYGAYVIRQQYVKRMALGTLGAVAIALALLFMPALINFLKTEEAAIESFEKKLYHELMPPPPIVKLGTPGSTHTISVSKLLVPKITADKTDTLRTEKIKSLAESNTTNEGQSTGLIKGIGTEDYILDYAEQMPQFPGGEAALAAFISQQIRYPQAAQRQRITGVVFVEFVVNTDGSIDHVKTIKGFHDECNKEAERVVSIMPDWEPGRQEGKPVKVRFALPIKFRLGASPASRHNGL